MWTDGCLNLWLYFMNRNMPYMKFLFVRSDVCRRLLSDSNSRWTMLVPSIQKNAAPEVFPSAAHYWKFVFLVCSFPLRRIAVTGSCFLFVLFCLCLTSVSRHQNCLQIGYLSIDNFSLLTDSLSLQQCSFKAFIFFFSPLAGFTTMASFFLFTKILKKTRQG